MAWYKRWDVIGDYGGQILIWLATSAVFPAAVFYGYFLAGDSKENQIGKGQLLLVAAALTAPIVGALISLPGKRTFGKSLLFAMAFGHVATTVFYFAAAADGTRDATQIAVNSMWLYLFAVVIGVCSVVISGRAIEKYARERVKASQTVKTTTPASTP
jgi:hypothetical protein